MVMISGIRRRLDDRYSLDMSTYPFSVFFFFFFLSFSLLPGALKTVQRLPPRTPRTQDPNSEWPRRVTTSPGLCWFWHWVSRAWLAGQKNTEIASFSFSIPQISCQVDPSCMKIGTLCISSWTSSKLMAVFLSVRVLPCSMVRHEARDSFPLYLPTIPIPQGLCNNSLSMYQSSHSKA